MSIAEQALTALLIGHSAEVYVAQRRVHRMVGLSREVGG
jgi:hypothetical protein